MDKSLEKFAAGVLDVMPLMVREFARRENNDLTRGKISCPQMVALHHAAQHDRSTVSDIAKILHINKSSASVLVDRLIRQKLMARRHDDQDRRVVWVRITPQGRKVVSQIMSQKRRSIKAIFGQVSQKERGQYLSVLLKVKSHLSAPVMILVLGMMLAQAGDAQAFESTRKVTFVEVETGKKELSLQQAFLKALKRSESVAITAEEMNQAQARFYRAFDYFLPTVSFQMTRMYQDAEGGASGSNSISNSQRPNTPEKKFVFSQPLFSGFKEFAALQASGADKKQQAYAWRRAKELLFVDVTEAFYNVLQNEKDAEVLVNTHELLSKRLEELGGRVKIGRSRDSENKAALADLKLIESDLVSARSQERAARNLLEFYLGEPVDGLVLREDNEIEETANFSVSPEKASMRADVLSDEQAYIVAQKGVVGAQADLFPKIYLDGNYYTQRVGFQSGNDWDMTLTFDVPVFEVGQTLGDIKEAASTREKARLKQQQTKRTAELDIRDAEEAWESSRASEKALQEADQASKENYDSLTLEYRSNLVGNLDVLDSLRRYQDVERRYHAARYTAKINYWKLRVAAGDVPGVDA